MRNLPIDAKRCRGADEKFNPTICPARSRCQRHVQLELDRQLCLPPEVTVNIRAMVYPIVGNNTCHFWIPVGSAA
ncbi:MAG TPA: hypothetical protein P5305_01470 [Rubrivivax sp.]|nr:hypothetical protein [Rubrivivax sp.]HRY86522.1 hypothetical protein [Rubrivivax sp.]